MRVCQVLGEVLCQVLGVLAGACTALALVPVTVGLARADAHLLVLGVLAVLTAALGLGASLGLLALARGHAGPALTQRGWSWGTYTDAPGLARCRVRATRRCGGLSVQVDLAGRGLALRRRPA